VATKTYFSCQNCGYQSPKWLGRCPECAEWNSMAEEIFSNNQPVRGKSIISDMVSVDSPQRLSEIRTKDPLRTPTKIGELDRVLGGGLVKGSVVLIGGEPGIGKSTLMLQASEIISRERKVLYVSGEESLNQIKLRAERLGTSSNNLYLVNETNIDRIIDYIKSLKPDLVVIDSIQIVYSPEFSQTAGTVTQIKESAGCLTALAKSIGVSLFIIGHITKEGFIAGPKILEHIVDSVIYFEGERRSKLRILRAIKNRFGPVDEVGIFSMSHDGLKEVKDPSGIFISDRDRPEPGIVIMATIEGTRPLLVEVQALAAPSNFGMPRQRSMGFDFNRMALLIAMIEKSMGLNLSNHDLFVNIAGGVKVNETASDLAVSVAIISSFKEKPVKEGLVIIGEVGLTSEVRSVSQIEPRINEARRLGFKQCIIPASDAKELKPSSNMELIGVNNLREAVQYALTNN